MTNHPNRRPFKGILTYVDRPSDKAPTGSRGRRVILTRQAAESALPTLVGMAVDYCPDWSGHDYKRKIGIISDARVNDDKLEVEGYLFALNFPEVLRDCDKHKGKLGMSYELADAHIENMRSAIYTVVKLTFTGAAILLQDRGAYKQTKFELV